MKTNKMTLNTNNLALYRKYRPQEFNDVIGQDLATEMLKNAIKNNKIYHAYIFSGDRGTGKTTVARIFAKEIGCAPQDIFELDAASNNSVDDMRLIIDATKTSTFGSKYKIYILDEAHMLSKSAFNALLKTLEEPPSHVIFILATTDKHKIPNTILSRCQEINFISPRIEIIENLLTKVSEKENIKIQKEAKNKIAEEAKGSFRDALGILEKVINLNNNKKDITLKDLENSLGIISQNELMNTLEAIGEKNILKLFTSINNLKLETGELVFRAYIDIVKLFELSLYMRFVSIEESFKIFNKEIGEKIILKSKELAEKYPKVISSNNLYKLLEMEKYLNENNNLKKTILITGLLRIIEE